LDGAALHITGEGKRSGVWRNATKCAPSNASVAASIDAGEFARTSGSDSTRLERAFNRCSDDLYRFILLRVSNDRHAADDILQQTCFEAAKHRRIPSGDDAIQAWLFGIAKNLIRKHFRRARRDSRQRISIVKAEEHAASSESTSHDAAGDSMDHDEAVPRLLDAIAVLNEADQELILGSYFEGRSHEELARVVGVSVRAIEGRLHRARNALRAVLGPQFGEVES